MLASRAALVMAPLNFIQVAVTFPQVICGELSAACGFFKAQHISRGKGGRSLGRLRCLQLADHAKLFGDVCCSAPSRGTNLG